jgi:hypothetical protein
MDAQVREVVDELKVATAVRVRHWQLAEYSPQAAGETAITPETHLPTRLWITLIGFVAAAVLGGVEFITYLLDDRPFIAPLPALTLMLIGGILTFLNVVILGMWWQQRIGELWAEHPKMSPQPPGNAS